MSGHGKGARSEPPAGMSRDEYVALLRVGGPAAVRHIPHRSFSGSDIRAVLYVPPNPAAEVARFFGHIVEFASIQTITISSHRPAGAVRSLGNASAKWVRGVRTFAGSMIFNRLDRDAFMDAYGQSELERPDIAPFFTDQIPPFHILLHGQNEHGMQASATIMGITLTDFGGAFTIEDLVPEDTYSFVAEGYRPFMNRVEWEAQQRDLINAAEQHRIDDHSTRRVSDLGWGTRITETPARQAFDGVQRQAESMEESVTRAFDLWS